jgi:MtN3 and saliva related transmembrane protein
MNFIDCIGYAAAIIATLIFLPQVVHTIKTRDTKGLSLTTYILLTISNSLWATYGLLTSDYAIIFAQVFLLPMGVCILGYKLKYG